MSAHDKFFWIALVIGCIASGTTSWYAVYGLEMSKRATFFAAWAAGLIAVALVVGAEMILT